MKRGGSPVLEAWRRPHQNYAGGDKKRNPFVNMNGVRLQPKNPLLGISDRQKNPSSFCLTPQKKEKKKTQFPLALT